MYTIFIIATSSPLHDLNPLLNFRSPFRGIRKKRASNLSGKGERLVLAGAAASAIHNVGDNYVA